MRARRLLVLIVLGAVSSTGCYWAKKSGPRGTNLDPSEIPKAGEHPDGKK